jgi:DNA-binding LacI/PurR family transcriptional regulator
MTKNAAANEVLTKKGVVKRQLLSEIKSGRLAPGTHLPSTRVLAGKCGVSYVTLHRILTELEKDGYIQRRNGVGTFVGTPPGHVAITKIGIPIGLEFNRFFVDAYEEISRQANLLNIQTVLGARDSEEEFLDRLAEENVNAVLRFPGNHAREHAIQEKLARYNMRAVMLNDWWHEGGGRFPCVMTDEEAAAAEMLDHLYSLGHRRIALYQESTFGLRVNLTRAFYRWHYGRGLTFGREQLMTYEDVDIREPLRFWEWVERNRITAVFFSHDFNVMRALPYWREAGIADPQARISIAGFDDIADSAELGLTSIRQNTRKLVSEAFRLLRSIDYHRNAVVKISARCVIRTSTRPPRELAEPGPGGDTVTGSENRQ